jgi:hypothetical protein
VQKLQKQLADAGQSKHEHVCVLPQHKTARFLQQQPAEEIQQEAPGSSSYGSMLPVSLRTAVLLILVPAVMVFMVDMHHA